MADHRVMAVDEVLISVAPGETRAAFLVGGEVERFILDRPSSGPRIGDLYLGRVTKSVAALDAAFVDIGFRDAGFLALTEARPNGLYGGTIKQFANEGDRVVVQVTRTPQGGKGAKLTLRPALASAHLVLRPYAGDLAPSEESPPAVDPQWLQKFAHRVPNEAGSWTFLPAAAGASESTIVNEARQLCALWQDALARSRTMTPPALLAAGPDPIVAALAHTLPSARLRVVVDDARVAAKLRSAFPDLSTRIQRCLPGRSVFADSGVDEQIETLLLPVIDLACGGTISIAETAAVVAIDIDAGATDTGGREATAFAVNREAADVIARQVCLRDLAGHIVIDFVPMRRRANRHKLLTWLSRAFARHSCPVELAGFTRLGLVELTRRRQGPSLPEMMLEACPACDGRSRVMSPLTVALKALREVLAEDRAAPGRIWTIEAAPSVIAALTGAATEARKETEARIGRPLKLVTSDRCGLEGYAIHRVMNREQEGKR